MDEVALILNAGNETGLKILEDLKKEFKGQIYVTTENESPDYRLKDIINAPDARINHLQLNVTKLQSILNIREIIQERVGFIDLIVNNIDQKRDESLCTAEQIRNALNVNFFGSLNALKLLVSLMRPTSKIVNITTEKGFINYIPNEEIRKKFSATDLSENKLVDILNEYESAARKGITQTEGWGDDPYVISKILQNILTIVHHKEYSDQGISINSVYPGQKVSAKSQNKVLRTKNPVMYVCFKVDPSFSGNFVWADCSVKDWYDETDLETTRL